MSNTQAIIVYRSPAEAAMRDTHLQQSQYLSGDHGRCCWYHH